MKQNSGFKYQNVNLGLGTVALPKGHGHNPHPLFPREVENLAKANPSDDMMLATLPFPKHQGVVEAFRSVTGKVEVVFPYLLNKQVEYRSLQLHALGYKAEEVLGGSSEAKAVDVTRRLPTIPYRLDKADAMEEVRYYISLFQHHVPLQDRAKFMVSVAALVVVRRFGSSFVQLSLDRPNVEVFSLDDYFDHNHQAVPSQLLVHNTFTTSSEVLSAEISQVKPVENSTGVVSSKESLLLLSSVNMQVARKNPIAFPQTEAGENSLIAHVVERAARERGRRWQDLRDGCPAYSSKTTVSKDYSHYDMPWQYVESIAPTPEFDPHAGGDGFEFGPGC